MPVLLKVYVAEAIGVGYIDMSDPTLGQVVRDYIETRVKKG